MKRGFSAMDRELAILQLSERPLDVLVIGGGITGAGIAWDAASRGLRTGLVEMRDFAWGTSSRSTKLIHGGLRYLKQGELQLVREVGRERALLHSKAPHLINPTPMLLPFYQGGTYGYWSSSIGLYVYDWLAQVKRDERRRMCRSSETLQLEPLLNPAGLKGAGLYVEYQTDDARLTIEILKSAHALGAIVVNYAKAESFIYTQGMVSGVELHNMINGELTKIHANIVINAAGPWVDEVRAMDDSREERHLLLTKGVHLVVDRKRLPVHHAAYLDAGDGRMIFVIPRGRKTYIGTTDTVYNEAIEKPRTTEQDRNYLLKAVNAKYPMLSLTPKDVESSWAGLRPLIHEAGKKPSEISRKDEIFISRSGLISIAGGKLTGFRIMAQKTLNLAMERLKRDEMRGVSECRTHVEPISAGIYEGYDTYARFHAAWMEEGRRRGIGRDEAAEIIALYGGNVPYVYAAFDRLAEQAHLNSQEECLLIAELDYCIQHEMSVTALDFLVRRTGWLYFQIEKVRKVAAMVIQYMGDQLNWDEDEQNRQAESVLEAIEQATEFPIGEG